MGEIAFILTSVVNVSYKANFDATIFCGQKKVCSDVLYVATFTHMSL